MLYSPVALVHIGGGMVGVFAGSTALVARKGARVHRRAGAVFVISMLIMSAAGAYAAFTKSQLINILAGVLTFYLVATAGFTVRRKPNQTGRLELGLLLLGLAVGISGLGLGWEAAHRATGSLAGDPAAAYVVFGLLAPLFVIGDIRMLMRGGVSGTQRLVRHLWRMCLALFIAAGSFFLGTASDPVMKKIGLRATLFTPAIRKTHLPEAPVLIIVALTIFWLCRVQFTNAYKKTRT